MSDADGKLGSGRGGIRQTTARSGGDAKRIQALRDSRAILSVAAAKHWRDHSMAPNYYIIAKSLQLPTAAADLADEIWNTANGPEEGPELEENALERCNDLLEAELNK